MTSTIHHINADLPALTEETLAILKASYEADGAELPCLEEGPVTEITMVMLRAAGFPTFIRKCRAEAAAVLRAAAKELNCGGPGHFPAARTLLERADNLFPEGSPLEEPTDGRISGLAAVLAQAIAQQASEGGPQQGA